MSDYLSDQLRMLHGILSEHDKTGAGVIIDAERLSDLTRALLLMEHQCRELENEISRLRWNAGDFTKQREIEAQQLIDAVINEMAKPNSNVVGLQVYRKALRGQNNSTGDQPNG